MEIDKDELMLFLKKKIDKNRFLHSMNTAKEAVALAKKFGADEEKAYIAGLLHDISKGLPADTLKKIAYENNVEIDEYEIGNPELMHGKIGAMMVKKELGITDKEILSAIQWHTTGHKNMSFLDKIIYLADIIEPGRKFKEAKAIRELAYKDIDAAMILGLEKVMSFVLSEGLILHPDSIEAYNSLKELEEKKGV